MKFVYPNLLISILMIEVIRRRRLLMRTYHSCFPYRIVFKAASDEVIMLVTCICYVIHGYLILHRNGQSVFQHLESVPNLTFMI